MNMQEWVNEEFLDESIVMQLKESFLHASPFSHIVLDDFFDEDKLFEVLNELCKEEFAPKESDLFSLKQTQDLVSSESELLQKFRSFLLSKEFTSYVYSITGIKVKEGVIDLAGSLYEDTDRLLCHDDKLDSRKIAFLIYLSELEEEDGGSLDLYSSENGMPKDIVKRIVPKGGRVALFEVSDVSFHQVSEVVSDSQRIALGGWFHV